MNTRQLQYMVILAEEKSFLKAANRLVISQPSLSQFVHKLEEEVGAALFERTVPLRLTDAGEVYVETAKKMLHLEEEMKKKMADILGGQRGRIRIGTGYLNSKILLPNIISLYQKRFPEVRVDVLEDVELNLKGKLDEGDLDLIVTSSFYQDAMYDRIELFQEEFLLAVPTAMSFGRSGYPYGEFLSVDSEQIKDLPFIMLPSNTHINDIVNMIYHEKGNEPKQIAQCTSLVASYSMTKAGVGASLVSFSTYKTDYSQDVNYYRINGCNFRRIVQLYTNKNNYTPVIVKEFIQESENYCRDNYKY